MGETAINANTPEAQRLYTRGVAAARGGQKRLAAGLLTRSVQLDPRNEAAWLWLSGVLEDPHQIAFCLRAVLRLNPANERAKKGLSWLDERKLLEQAPAKPALALSVPPVPQPAQVEAAHLAPERERREAWWVGWRRTRREDSKIRLLVPVVLIVMLVSILLLHQSLVQAHEQRAEQRAAAQLRALATPTPLPTPLPTPSPMVAILEVDTAPARDAASMAYLSVLTPLRQQLRDAVDSYRNASGQPGAQSVALASSVRTLRDEVQRAQAMLQSMPPPTPLHAAHEEYLKGLELELKALDDLLEFYGSYRQELANRAALRFQEANSHFARARQSFDQQPLHMEQVSRMSAHTPR